MTGSFRSSRQRAFGLPVLAVAGLSLVFAACGASGKTSTSSATNSTSTSGPTTTSGPSTAMEASVTFKVANVPGLGNVLVNGDGLTLYVLTTEKGGHITCTAANGCTKIWPPAVLPSGMSHGVAGAGVNAALLGVAMGPSGDVVTYGGYPVYTFSEDTVPGQAKGQGVKDQWGTWWALNPAGTPIIPAAAPAATAPPATSPAATSPPATSPPATSPPTTQPPSTSTSQPSSGGGGF